MHCRIPWVVPALIAALGGCGEMPAPAAKTPVKSTAASGLERLPPPAVVPDDAFANVAAALAEVEAANRSGQVEDQQRLVRVEQWLNQQGAKIAPDLAAVISDQAAGDASRVTACRVLARLGAVATPTLLEATASPTKRVRLKAIESLGKIKPPTHEIVARLVSLLDESDLDSRRAALSGLTAIGPAAKSADPGLVEKLIGLQNNLAEEDTLRTAANAALKKIEPRKKLAE